MQRFWLKLLLVAAAVVTVSGAGLAAVDTRPEGVRAIEWARAHVSDLPADAELIFYPRAYRQAAFGVMSVQAKSRYAQRSLRWYAATHKVSSDQRAFLEHTAEALTAEMFMNRGTDRTASQQMNDLCQQLVKLFPDKEERALVASYGAQKDKAEPAVLRALVTVRRLFDSGIAYASGSSQPLFIPCDCARETWCSICENCRGYCNVVYENCGCFFQYTCDATCKPAGATAP